MGKDELRRWIYQALLDQWNRDIDAQVARTSEGHVEVLTEAVMTVLATGVLDGQ